MTSRVTIALGNALPTCEVYSSDTMLYIAAANLATYADVSVVCGPLETLIVRKNGRSLGQAVTNPTIIVESSPSRRNATIETGSFRPTSKSAFPKDCFGTFVPPGPAPRIGAGSAPGKKEARLFVGRTGP